MGTTAKCLLQSKLIEDSVTTQYTAPSGVRTIIDKCTSYSAAGGTITLHIVGQGSTASATNIKVVKTLAAGEAYTFPEIVGQILNPGDFVAALTAAPSTVSLRLSGRENT